MAAVLAPETVRRLAALRVVRFEPGAMANPPAQPRNTVDTATAITHVVERWSGDLCGFLNALTRGELQQLATALDAAGPQPTRSPELRLALWELGAQLETGGTVVSPCVQPRPNVLGGHLVIEAPPHGMYPASTRWPRAVPPPTPAMPPLEEPDNLDELLGAADRAIGVRLGRRGRDKGAWGMRAATLLGVVERGGGEPDWRGDVEIKTVAVARETLRPEARWRIVDDPAIAMVSQQSAGEPALAKLQRTLWLARADVGDGDATIVSWYLLEWDAQIARLAHRYLHLRPKGPAGTDARGLYLHKRFFADTGFLATLNGVGVA